MYFTKEDVEAGLMTKLIDYLCQYSYQCWSRDFAHYNDIHIKPDDCDAFVVEWEQRPWSGEYGGKFEYVGEEQVVCNEVIYPDGTSGYSPCSQEDEIEIWLEYHPGWEKDEYGHWHYSEPTDDHRPQKPKDKMSQWLDENAGWHDSENGWTKE